MRQEQSSRQRLLPTQREPGPGGAYKCSSSAISMPTLGGAHTGHRRMRHDAKCTPASRRALGCESESRLLAASRSDCLDNSREFAVRDGKADPAAKARDRRVATGTPRHGAWDAQLAQRIAAARLVGRKRNSSAKRPAGKKTQKADRHAPRARNARPKQALEGAPRQLSSEAPLSPAAPPLPASSPSAATRASGS